MAVIDQNTLLRCKDQDGNEYLLYPITKLDCVDGAEDLLHYGAAQELTDAEKIQARDNIGALCAPVGSDYIANGKFLKVTGVDSAGRITSVEASDSETYSHPSTHPASMITGLADIATSGTYNDLIDKPFGDIYVVPEREYAFALNSDGFDCYDGALPLRDTPTEGETYVVSWDGTEYNCELKNIADFLPNLSNASYLGNTALFFGYGSGTDTGEPFFMMFDKETAKVLAQTSDTATAHTISVKSQDNVRKIDEKYLPDGLATEGYVQNAIADIEVSGSGSGSVVTETDILSEQTFENFAFDNTYDAYTCFSAFGENVEEFTIVVGENYTVVWDGVAYNVTAADASVLVADAVFLGNGTAWGLDGNDEPFVIGWIAGVGVYFISLTDEATSHTVRIYQTADLKVGWDNITDKPFGEELVAEIFEGQFVDTQDEDGNWAYEALILDDSATNLVVGNTYVVTWNGVEYTKECKSYIGMSCLANDGMFGGDDDGAPFIIVRDVTGLVSGAPGWYTTIISEYAVDTGIYDCKIEGRITTKLSEQYQHQSDWDENDKNSAAHILNRPFGEIAKSGTVLGDIESVYDKLDGGFIFYDIDTGTSFLDTSLIVEGVSYAISIDDFIFNGVGATSSELMEIYGTPAISKGIFIYDATDALIGTVICYYGVIAVLSLSEGMDDALGIVDLKGSHHVKISILDGAKKIDQKYLPYGTNTIYTDVITSFDAPNLLTSEIEDVNTAAGQLQDAGLYEFQYEVSSSDEYWTTNKFTIGETYAIAIGDEIIYAEAKHTEGDFEVYFGNLAIMTEVDTALGQTVGAVTDTGEDFLIISIDSGGTPTGGFSIYSRTNYGNSISVSFYSIEEKVTQIDQKYIPGPPEFDLVAMGLPALTLDGSTVSVEVDATELVNALQNNVVKVKFNASINSVDIQFNGILNALWSADGTCNAGFNGALSGVPMMLNFTISTSSITGCIFKLVDNIESA